MGQAKPRRSFFRYCHQRADVNFNADAAANAGEAAKSVSEGKPYVAGLATQLIVQLSRLGRLYHDVNEQRALPTSTGLGWAVAVLGLQSSAREQILRR